MEASLDTCGQRTAQSLLLLLYLLVIQAAADCPKPQDAENIVLTDDALLLNDFPEGVEVSLECATGYRIESGSGTITCIGGTWTIPDLTCKKKDCGEPNPQPNMIFNTSAGTLFGDIVKVTCNKGYQISGATFKQCYDVGWIGNTECNIVACRQPAEVTNGKSLWDAQDNPIYGEIIQYTCNEGYTLIGEGSLMCGETGEYNAPPPECKGVTAEDRTTTESPAQAASTSGDSSATPTAFTSSVTPTVSPSVRGGGDILRAGDTTTSVSSNTSSSFQGNHGVTVDDNKDFGYIPVIISVVVVSLVVFIVVFIIHKFLLKRKGSYDTREDLKPELLQFQNL